LLGREGRRAHRDDVELYTIFGGDHTWPGADIAIGPTTPTVDATRLALDFFEAHPHAG
jgi:polyhydroxybutyrate depolymerase